VEVVVVFAYVSNIVTKRPSAVMPH